jgi:hypothetical protein
VISSSFWCPVEKLHQLQGLVKSTDARFGPMLDPAALLAPDQKSQYVRIEFDTPEKYTEFTTSWERITTGITEKATPRWKQMARRLFGKNVVR